MQIAPGITGLLPKSKWRDSVDAASFENKKKGDTFLVSIDEVLFDQKRISLGVPGTQEDQSWRDHSSAGSTAKSAFATNNFGALSQLMNSKNGKK